MSNQPFQKFLMNWSLLRIHLAWKVTFIFRINKLVYVNGIFITFIFYPCSFVKHSLSLLILLTFRKSSSYRKRNTIFELTFRKRRKITQKRDISSQTIFLWFPYSTTNHLLSGDLVFKLSSKVTKCKQDASWSWQNISWLYTIKSKEIHQ